MGAGRVVAAGRPSGDVGGHAGAGPPLGHMEERGVSATTKATVLIVEDHELLAESLSFTLSAEGYAVEVVLLESLEGITAAARAIAPDVVLLDLDLGHLGSALPLVAPLTGQGADVLVVTGSTDLHRIAETIEAGAVGYVQKSQPYDELLAAVVDVAEGRTPLSATRRTELLLALRGHRQARGATLSRFARLTRREAEVLAALLDGGSAETIARDWVVAITTVRSHIQKILQKLEVKNQIAAVAEARRAGWSPARVDRGR